MTTDGPRHRALDPEAGNAPAGGREKALDAEPEPGSAGGSPEGPGRPPGRHRPPPRTRLRSALLILVGALVVTLGLTIGALTLATRHYEGNVSRIPHAFPPSTGRPSTAPAAAGSVTLLVTAVEADRTAASGLLADTVMLVRFTADGAHAQVVFLPVNLWMTPSGQAAGTLGGIFRAGGSSRVIGAVEGASGIRVDHYAQLDFAGFQTITDALGGVDAVVPAPYADQGHSFAAGPQHMNGETALAYVRAATTQAHTGDAARQQLVINALFTRLGKVGALSNFGRLTAVIGTVSQALSVDDTLDDPRLVRLAWDRRHVASPEFVKAPVSGGGVANPQSASFPDARIAQLWSYLRSDSLSAHLGEFN